MENILYKGKYCSGYGDLDLLELIDNSFEMMHPTPRLPNISMLYNKRQNTFAEGFFWNGWWIQNSYGFAYCSVPFLSDPWATILQNSLDLFWSRIGDGKRRGADNEALHNNKVLDLIAPDGSLGDCVGFDQGIFYKQGDGETHLHDWFYEAAAAGIVMQAELLLRAHDPLAVNKYLPLLERSCNFIENTRDKSTGLFLAGPASNLLAPSYGGALSANNTIEKGYPAGIAITYTAALQRMCELFRLIGDKDKELEYISRIETTMAALPVLLTEEGYFVKSMDRDGTKHGIYGCRQYGYLEGVANADAMAFDVVDRETRESIYEKINSVKGIRPYDFLLTNYPALDDTYEIYLGKGHSGFYKFGDWVNGGCWGTVEGRAILGYLRLNKFDDAFASASRAMAWAKEYRMDAPFSQCGKNSNNPWSDRKGVSPVSVMVDNFAIPAATIRGLFEYKYSNDSITLIPHIPPTISEYIQHEPIFFGEKRIYITILNGTDIYRVCINGTPLFGDFSNGVILYYDNLPQNAFVSIVMNNSTDTGNSLLNKAELVSTVNAPEMCNVPERIKSLFVRFENILYDFLGKDPYDYQYLYAAEVMSAIKAYILQLEITYDKRRYLRPMNKHKIAAIEELYFNAAESLAAGYMKTFNQD